MYIFIEKNVKGYGAPRTPGGERRRLTAAEIEWVDENHPGWVVKMANEEHAPDRYDPEVPSCDYFGTLRYM